LHRNSGNGDLYGGIYASRLAARFGLSHQFNDPLIPYKYLNAKAMKEHKFLRSAEPPYKYKLIFNKEDPLYVVLPAPVLFDFQQKGRYCLTESEVNEYNAAV
jgi:hypothetical protein